VIPRFIETVEKLIASTPIILSSNLQKHFGPDAKTAYVKGNIIFIDSSVLEIAIFASETSNAIHFDKYRFHYMNNQGQAVFRYDNAPHHPEISSFPHHKHTPNEISESTAPSLKNIMNEISAIIINK
jgi:hypothetical protein